MNAQSTNSYYKTFFLCTLFTYLLLIIFGVKEFQLWEQIDDLHKMGMNVSLKEIYSHPHGMRFMIVSPTYLFADLLHIAPNTFFSFYVFIMCVTISITLTKSLTLFQKTKNAWACNFFIFLFIAILSLFMNGRLIFGLCAYSLMTYSFFLLAKGSGTKKYTIASCLITLAILLSSATSGVAISLYAIVFSAIPIFLISSFKSRTIISFCFGIYMLAIFLLYAPIISILINKNLTSFGNGYDAIISMTQHGTLSGLAQEPTKSIAVEKSNPMPNNFIFKILYFGFTSLLICFAYVYRHKLIRDFQLLFTVYCMALLIVLSSFAYSILMMAFIPAIIMLAIISSQFRTTRGRFFDEYQVAAPNNKS